MSTFRVTGRLDLDGTRFAAGLSRAEIGAKRFAQTVTHEIGNRLAGLFALGALERIAHKTIETTKELATASQRLGIGVEQLQVLKQAAKDANSDLDAMAKLFERIDVARAKALAGGPGSDKTLAAFRRLGVTPEDLRKITASQLVMGPIANAAKSKSPEDIIADLKEIAPGLRDFGSIIPVLKTDFDELSAKMRRLGGIISTEDAVSLKMLADYVDLLGTVIISNAAPAIIWLVERLYESWSIAEAGVNFFVGALYKLDPIAIVKAWLTGGVPAAMAQLYKQVDLKEGKAQAEAVALERIKTLNAIKDKVAEDAEKLRHPAAPNFDVETAPAKPKSFHQAITSDSLLAVGNFLGASRDPLTRVAQQTLDEQRTTNRLLGQVIEAVKGLDGGDSLGLPD